MGRSKALRDAGTLALLLCAAGVHAQVTSGTATVPTHKCAVGMFYSNLATTTVLVRPDTTNGSVNVIVTPPAANTKYLYATAVVEWAEVAF